MKLLTKLLIFIISLFSLSSLAQESFYKYSRVLEYKLEKDTNKALERVITRYIGKSNILIETDITINKRKLKQNLEQYKTKSKKKPGDSSYPDLPGFYTESLEDLKGDKSKNVELDHFFVMAHAQKITVEVGLHKDISRKVIRSIERIIQDHFKGLDIPIVINVNRRAINDFLNNKGDLLTNDLSTSRVELETSSISKLIDKHFTEPLSKNVAGSFYKWTIIAALVAGIFLLGALCALIWSIISSFGKLGQKVDSLSSSLSGAFNNINLKTSFQEQSKKEDQSTVISLEQNKEADVKNELRTVLANTEALRIENVVKSLLLLGQYKMLQTLEKVRDISSFSFDDNASIAYKLYKESLTKEKDKLDFNTSLAKELISIFEMASRSLDQSSDSLLRQCFTDFRFEVLERYLKKSPEVFPFVRSYLNKEQISLIYSLGLDLKWASEISEKESEKVDHIYIENTIFEFNLTTGLFEFDQVLSVSPQLSESAETRWLSDNDYSLDFSFKHLFQKKKDDFLERALKLDDQRFELFLRVLEDQTRESFVNALPELRKERIALSLERDKSSVLDLQDGLVAKKEVQLEVINNLPIREKEDLVHKVLKVNQGPTVLKWAS